MNSGPTSERVYDAIRREILSRAFRPGQRLDPAVLAQGLSSSVTPVRDALHMLAGQGLVHTGTSEGFHIAHIDVPALEDLYRWNLEVLQLAIRAWPRAFPVSSASKAPERSEAADATAATFAAISGLSRNVEHARAVGLLNDRLQAIRAVERGVIDQPDAEIGSIASALAQRDALALRRCLVVYHRVRLRKAAEIVRASYRS